MTIRSAAAGLAAALSVALCGTAAAPALAAGDPEHGAVLANTCLGCHGSPYYSNTYPTYRVPKLGGQNSAYIESSLKAYRSGERRHPTMHAQAVTLSDEDIADIAAYLSQAPRR